MAEMKRKFLVLLACTAAGLMSVAATAEEFDGDPIAGKDKSALCQGCHGENGISADATFPKLAGQFAGYIKKQVLDFQAAKRNDDTMAPMAATVTELQDLKDIAAYFSSQPIMKGEGKGKGNKLGEDIFKNGNKAGAYGCANCHGSDGKGRSSNNPLFPVIGGQHKGYLVKQLNDLKSGTRTNDPAGMMADIAKKLSDKEIEAVADYVSSL